MLAKKQHDLALKNKDFIEEHRLFLLLYTLKEQYKKQKTRSDLAWEEWEEWEELDSKLNKQKGE